MTNELLKYFNNDELAANVWLSKYAYEGETNPEQMHLRMAKSFYKVDKFYTDEIEPVDKTGLNLSNYRKERSSLSQNQIFNYFKDFKYIVPQGSIMSTLGTKLIASLSNCWVAQSPYDSYGGILKTDGDLAYYYKRRGGVGTDISNLRPEGTSTNNTAKSTTGAVSFMPRFSNTTREVAMNGRRGALMLSISINHPDSMKFIKVKRDGVSVTGANISIKLNDDFMNAVDKEEDYILRFPCTREFSKVDFQNEYDLTHYDYNTNYTLSDGTIIKHINAKEYWDEIIESAKKYAEPGLMYWDNVISYDPAATYIQFRPTCSNPCGEQFLNPNDSCRLMALNLFSFVKNAFTKRSQLDYEKLYNICYEYTQLGDNLITLELEYIQRIIDKIKSDPEPDDIKRHELELWLKSYKNTKAGRRIGLGITALADMLAALNLKYDSKEGLKVIDKVMKIKMKAELDCTIDLAILRGTFEGWDKHKEFNFDENGKILSGKNEFYQMIFDEFPEQALRMSIFGRRNISWSTIAPTGSVSLLTQTTSGCEPLFQPFYMRRKKINPGEKDVRVDFVDEIGDSWQEFAVLHPKFQDWINRTYGSEIISSGNDMGKDELQYWFEKSPWYNSTANDIDWIMRNQIQAILQRYTTNAISSTINLPSTVTNKEVSDIYMSGWKLKLKGQTVYVDGSRSGVLVSEDNKSKKDTFSYIDAMKRPNELDAEAYMTQIKGIKHSVIVGLIDNKPYEIFFESKNLLTGKGVIKKKSKAVYLFEQKDISLDISSDMTDEQTAITRLTSTSLRHGTDIKFIVEQLNKCDGDLFSFTKALARVLKKYIPDGEKSTVTCNDCDSSNVIFEEGCSKCLDCGSSKCG